MPPINPTSKSLTRLLFRRQRIKESCNQIRSFGTNNSCINLPCHKKKVIFGDHENNNSWKKSYDALFANQKRSFLGCGDGVEGNMLSKVYEEKRVLGYSPEQLFNVVAAVDMYEDFLPWCQRSEIVRRNPDGTFDAELQIGFKFLVESYISHVVLNSPKYIKTTSSQSTLFDHLINAWEFNPGPVPGSCNLYFLVDFKFRSPIYNQIANMFFKEVVSRLVGSFDERCRLIYGPAVPVPTVPVLENTLEK